MVIKNAIKRSFFALKTVFKYAPLVVSLYFIMAILSALFITTRIYFLRLLIDNLVKYLANEVDIKIVIIFGALYLLSYLGTNLYTFFLSRMGNSLTLNLTKTLTPAIIDKFSRIEYKYYENEQFKDIMKRMGQDPQSSIHNTFFSVIQCINNILKFIGILTAFFSASIIVGIGSIIIGLPMGFIEFKVTDRRQKLLREKTKEARIDDYLQGLLINKDYAYENKIFQNNEYINYLINENRKNIYKQRKKIANISARNSILVFLLKFTYVSLTVLLLSYLFISEEITLGVYVSIITAITSLLSILNSMAYTISTLGARTWAITYYKDFINFKEEVKDKEIKKVDTFKITFDNVSFTYPGTENKVLHNVSFKICSNDVVAIVGANGAGKSTIIKLLCGLYKPDKGRILINNQEVHKLTHDTIANLFSVVFQDFQCYQFSIRENVALGNMKIIDSDNEIKKALKQFDLQELCQDLDRPLGTIDKDAVNLSLGQWQKLVLARTFSSEATFSILDEPTASLDPITESKMYANFIKILKNKGAIIISHRLASARLADKILVIDRGKLVEQGNHDDLMKQNGLYSKMYSEQSSWYIDELGEVNTNEKP